jgi:HNH endonuclease
MRLSKAEKKRRRAARPPSQAKLKKLARGVIRRSLKDWTAEVLSAGTCAVCGVGVEYKRDKDGDILYSKKTGKPIIIHLHAHHLLPRERYKEFQTLPINGICLCPMHHKFSKFSAHRNPIWFSNWLRSERPLQYRWAKANMGEDPCLTKIQS